MDLNDKLHKLRNPINTISMNAELAKLMIGEKRNPEDLEVLIDRIIAQCASCADIISSMEEPD